MHEQDLLSQDSKSDKYIMHKKLHSEIQKVCQNMGGEDLRKQIKSRIRSELSEKWKNSKYSKKYCYYLSRCSLHKNNNGKLLSAHTQEPRGRLVPWGVKKKHDKNWENLLRRL